jgi:hypothetical protein
MMILIEYLNITVKFKCITIRGNYAANRITHPLKAPGIEIILLPLNMNLANKERSDTKEQSSTHDMTKAKFLTISRKAPESTTKTIDRKDPQSDRREEWLKVISSMK